MTGMTAPPDDWERWRPWLPDATAGLVLLLLGLWELHDDHVVTSLLGELLVVGGVAAAGGLSRHAPGVALTVAWLTGAVHIVTGTGPMVVEVFLAVVAFGCARWGTGIVVWLSGVSIPVGAAIAVALLDPSVLYDALDTAGIRVLTRTYVGGNGWRLPAGLLATALLMAPWLLGLALRFSARSEASRASQVAAEAERDQAEEIARLREEQARLARDVHDVVGHSLAVILVQAESAQYLEDADTGQLKQTMANIATSARASLEDVRSVLSPSQVTHGAHPVQVRQVDLESLLDGVRASGHGVESSLVGTPQPMPPELEVVAFRVLQEMLTNAIRHGRRDQPVLVERHWGEDLRIEVQNALPPDVPPMDETQPLVGVPGPPAVGGQGIDGMRRRLEAVGGRLDVRRRTDPATFTATAWVPVRVVS
jgi:signal transduction histidine kinase